MARVGLDQSPFPPDTYWAQADYSTEEGRSQLANSIYGLVKRYYEALPNSFAYATWTKALNIFHSLPGWYNPFAATVLGRGGSQGQNVSARVNIVGSMARSVIALLLQYIPEPDPSPVNTDTKSLEQASLVKDFLDKFVEENGVRQGFADVTKLAEIYGMAFLVIVWDPYNGPYKMEPVQQPTNVAGQGLVPQSMGTQGPVQPGLNGPQGNAPPIAQQRSVTPEGRPIRSGEIKCCSYGPLDVCFDLGRRDSHFDWLIVPTDINRYDLIARFPEAEEEIKNYVQPEDTTDISANINRLEMERKSERIADRDLLRLWTVYHRPTDAVPDGLVATVLGDSLLFLPGPLPYSRLPVILFEHGHIDRTPFGDSLFHQCLGLQDSYDDIFSSIITNLTAFSKQLLIIPRTADFGVAELTDGLAAIEYDPQDGTSGKPEGLQLVKIAPEAFRYVEETLPKVAQDIVGLNQATRGSPPPSWSGTLNEQVKQMALSYQNEAHNNLLKGCKEAYNLLLEILQNFVDEPIVTELAGIDGKKEVRAFTTDDFRQVRRVDVKLGSAFLKDPESKLDAARELGRLGIVDAGEFLEVMESGSLKDATEDDLAVERSIQAENEGIVQGGNGDLRDGQRDDLHMASHLKRIATLDASLPDELAAIQRFEQHVAAHDLKWRQKTQMSPGLMMALKQPPYPFPQPPPMPGGPAPAVAATPTATASMPGSRPPPGQAPGPVTPSGQPRNPSEESTK